MPFSENIIGVYETCLVRVVPVYVLHRLLLLTAVAVTTILQLSHSVEVTKSSAYY